MPLKVYYLDDEAALCDNFVDYFSSDTVSVKAFTDARTAIEAVKNEPCDLFFIDYRLPGITGEDVANAIDPKIRKFLISGDIALDIKFKFERVFSKPYRESEIQALIESYQ